MPRSSTAYHIAQANIGRIRGPIDGPVMAEFVAQLDPLNALADASPGFVWRLQGDEGNATAIHAYDDERLLINMSVWRSVDALAAYVYRSDHARVLASRKAWFEPMEGSTAVLWWVPAGHIPDVEEAKARLELLARTGPTPEAFTFARRFAPPTGDTANSG